jgi:Formylmethanofuran dehydrogenase subunit C
MDTVTLTLKKVPGLFLECDSITPDKFAGKAAAEIAELPCAQGKANYKLGDWFEIAGNAGATAADTKIVVGGKGTDKCKYIGAWMKAEKSLSTAPPICSLEHGWKAESSPLRETSAPSPHFR